MKVRHIYDKLDKLEDSFEAKVEYCKTRKDLKLISHMTNKYSDEYVFEGTDGYINIGKALTNTRINYGFGWSTEAQILVDGKIIPVSKE